MLIYLRLKNLQLNCRRDKVPENDFITTNGDQKSGSTVTKPASEVIVSYLC